MVLRRVVPLARLLVASAIACGQPTPTPASKAAPDPGPSSDPKPSAPEAAPPYPRRAAEIRASGNHLVGEPSPYLAQHAHNPIDWYPWSAEAFAIAAREKRPIFLSIGYSTCHWCHVMAHESFEDDAVAEFINAHFVAIKVDREQHPDIDALYLAALAAMGLETGWPLNVFLTPDGAPIMGGTYMPPVAKDGRPSFREVAETVRALWSTHGDGAAQRGKDVLDALARDGARGGAAEADAVARAFAELAGRRDEVRGGFGSRQKFPNVPVLLAALQWSTGPGDEADADARASAREHVVTTLVRMRDGALRDPIAGTFHRYCVDPDWTLPHFEKTLFDNAQLATLYLEAAHRLGEPNHLATARAILDDLLAHWRTAEGGLAVGFDADDAAGEGRYYTWTKAELDEALPPASAAAVAQVWGIDDVGHPALGGRSLLVRRRVDDASTVATADAALVELAKIRARRPAPARDDKVLVGPNAAAIEALVLAAARADEPRYLAAAVEIAELLHTRLDSDGRVGRGFMGDARLGDGFAEDHALLARADLRLHGATGDLRWLERAHALATTLSRDFWDDARRGVRATATTRAGLPVAPLAMRDHASPGGGAVAVAMWLELGGLVGDDPLWTRGSEALAAWQSDAADDPLGNATLLSTILGEHRGMHELVLAGAPDDRAIAELLAVAADAPMSQLTVARVPAEGVAEAAAKRWPALAGKVARAGKATAYLCNRGSCRAPTSDPAALRAQLARLGLLAP